MRRAILILCCLLLGGCEFLAPEPPELRLDDLMFGNKRLGLKSENPVFHPGEEFYFHYAQRGATAGANGKATVSLKAQLSHESVPLHQFERESYKINSEITSYGPTKAMKFRMPKDASGPGTLDIEVTDHVADNTITITLPYSIEPE